MIAIGVDAHKRVHAALALDDAGAVLGSWRGPNTAKGWMELQAVGEPMVTTTALGNRRRLELWTWTCPIPCCSPRGGLRDQSPLDG